MFSSKKMNLLLIICLYLTSCHPTKNLLIDDGVRAIEEYSFDEKNLYSIFINSSYTISGDLYIGIQLRNTSNGQIIFNSENISLNTNIFILKNKYVIGNNDAKSFELRENETKEFIIEPGGNLTFGISYNIDKKQTTRAVNLELWPWPKGEKLKLSLGEIIADNIEYELIDVEIYYPLEN